MATLAANSAASPSLSLMALETANAWQTARESGEESLSFLGGQRRSNGSAIAPRTSAAKAPMRTFVPCASAVMYPPIAWSLLRGHSGARRHCAALLRLRRPSGHGSSLKGTLQESATWRLGAGPTCLASPRCDPSKIGKFNKRRHPHVSEQSNPHRLPRQRRRSRNNDNRSFTTLSLATSRPTRKMANTSRTPNGTVVSSSESFRSSPAP